MQDSRRQGQERKTRLGTYCVRAPRASNTLFAERTCCRAGSASLPRSLASERRGRDAILLPHTQALEIRPHSTLRTWAGPQPFEGAQECRTPGGRVRKEKRGSERIVYAHLVLRTRSSRSGRAAVRVLLHSLAPSLLSAGAAMPSFSLTPKRAREITFPHFGQIDTMIQRLKVGGGGSGCAKCLRRMSRPLLS